MDDRFDEFLRTSLAPPERPADRAYALRVQARIALEEKWEIARRAALTRLAWDLAAVATVAAALLAISRAPAVAEFVTRAPAVALAIALAAFAMFILPLAGRAGAARPAALRRSN